MSASASSLGLPMVADEHSVTLAKARAMTDAELEGKLVVGEFRR